MTIEERFRNGIVIIGPRGRLTADTESAFSEAVCRLLERGRRRLVLDLAGVRYIDARGLGAITMACALSRNRGGDLKLLNLTKRNHHLFTITKLLTVMDAFDSEDEARRSFDSAGESLPVPSAPTDAALAT